VLERFEGSSVDYGASPLEAALVENEEVALVGGGNSTGQAAAVGDGAQVVAALHAMFASQERERNLVEANTN
tara:strand:+ start:45472 stop:45687 length:216 start_codon:yes stop_codon:yes gene_type:complete